MNPARAFGPIVLSNYFDVVPDAGTNHAVSIITILSLLLFNACSLHLVFHVHIFIAVCLVCLPFSTANCSKLQFMAGPAAMLTELVVLFCCCRFDLSFFAA